MASEDGTLLVQSWRRSEMCGVDPRTCLQEDRTIEPVNPQNRLRTAAAPVLDRVAEALDDNEFAVLLADRQARIVDIRAAGRGVRRRIDCSGVIEGRSMAEDAAGTNAIGTVLEEKQGIAVRGVDHFAEALRGFSCYGYPIVNPITRRIAGILDISCAVGVENPLLAPFLITAAHDIEDRLLDSATSPQRGLLGEFEKAVYRARGYPVIAMGEDVFLANVEATNLLTPLDHVALRAASELAVDGVQVTQDLVLSQGETVELTIAGERVGAVMILRTKDGTGQRVRKPTSTPPASASPVVLVTGEPGSGKKATARALLRGRSIHLHSGHLIREATASRQMREIVRTLEGDDAVIVTDVHLLPDVAARRLAEALGSSTRSAPTVLTSPSPDSLCGERARILRLVDDVRVLKPLRARRHEIPRLVAEILSGDGASGLAVSAEAMQILVDQPWPNNISDLAATLRAAANSRTSGVIAVEDLPRRMSSSLPRALSPIEQAQRDTIAEALRETGGNRSAAAEAVGISRTTLYRAIRRYRLT
ncbi:helix-turn-helix domain-containing protein [Gordonia sp. L191]|uniref:sigma-54-dependent Fis family transcriptional regulator n=1 Tax=Gordonia sp. L191 TaxID=2982699 RepID=UPI0024C0B6FA|nr:helix-turn-helix domain-containing protein [Gordonia sp. L191]WHU47728.1 helix-turn-helix domain-containing protein [Gordonia sp. L191]